MEKKERRRALLALRGGLDADVRKKQDAAILRHWTELPEVRAAMTVMLYLDFRGEVETAGMIAWALEQGKTVCAPVTVVEERKLIPVRIQGLDELVPGAYGIREPHLHEERVIPPEQIDAVLLPGVGFDRSGGRLGYGGGYYDRFLPRLRADAFKVAVAYEVQVVEELPLEPHDTLLDALVTEAGVWRRDPING